VNLNFFFTLGIIAFWVGIEGERLLLMGRVDVTSSPYVGVDEGGEAGRYMMGWDGWLGT
jgi:hypothetical protein